MTVFQKRRSVSLLLILMLMLTSLPSPSSAASRYKDVNIDHWAYSSIEWAFKKGIVKGNSDGTFAPSRILTEAEFITMLIRYDCDVNKKNVTGGASANYRYLKGKNIPLPGFINSKLRDEPIKRGDVARIVAAFNGLDLTMPHAVQYMYIKNLSNGMTGKKDYQDYGVDRSLSRAEAVVFLNQLSKRGTCKMVGLLNTSAGQDNQKYPLPINFLGEDSATFPPNETLPQTKPPVGAKPIDSRLKDLDIEKPKLIANGVDSTFMTLNLQDCYGNPIPYDQSLVFTASSKRGARISVENYENGNDAVAFAKSQLNVIYAIGESATGVTQNVTLPTFGANGTVITWYSNNKSIASNGIVTRPTFTEGNAIVTLTATISKNGIYDTKTFILVVLSQVQNDSEAVALAKSQLNVIYATGDSAAGVTQNVTLPTSGANGTVISWYSDNIAVAANGIVTRPIYSAGNSLVTLTATIRKNGVTDTKSFLVVVLKQVQNDAEAVSSAKDQLSIIYAAGDSEAGVTQNITLPTTGANSTVISWYSDNIAIAANGTVTRPKFGLGNAMVNLTATIIKNEASSTKTFKVIVLEQPSPIGSEIIYQKAAEVSYAYSAITQTDGPELTIKVTAPASNTVVQDTISFQLNYQSNLNMSCYQKPVTIELTYEPQAELRLEVGNKNLSPNGQTTVTAKIVRPGGQTIWDYNGKVRFRSAKGAILGTQEAYFYNGVASTSVSPLSTSYQVNDEISAEIIQSDSRYNSEISSVLNKTFYTNVIYDPRLSPATCQRGELEVAFIIDSSGSMKRNDPERLRVSKSKELINTINANFNIGSHFNERGYMLGNPGSVNSVSYSFDNVFQSGGTNIGEGLEQAFTKFTNSTSSQKVAILLTDGKSSERKATDMMNLAKSKGIKIFTIGLGDTKQLNESLLLKMASETGGKYYQAEKNTDISIAYQSILYDVTCGVSYPVCSQSGYVFTSPKLEVTSSDFYMNTYINENCGEVDRVVLRLQSTDGDIDYELIHRGQNYYALQKEKNEIENFSLYNEGTFLAYNRDGTLVGQLRIPMSYK
ncbi:immunoglobulin-like domain-containing protein [Bacillus sp. CGMCC 1.16607]|uniref:immunoglobulin-like domain-containing protein n=1 Tax=Bacillus sp. CGMCC 1.16607 TaxID=3351842 RepID=UPI00363E9305